MSKRLGFVSPLLGALACSPASANLVTNGDFELPSLSRYLCFNDSTVAGWTSSGNHGSCYMRGLTDNLWPTAYSGGQLLYVNDFGDSGTTVRQTLQVVANQTYALSFAMAGLLGRPTVASLTVDAGSAQHSFTGTSFGAWTQHSWTFTPGASGALVLGFTSQLRLPVNIDAVAVDLAPPQVPEPSAAALMALGLAGLGLASRRRQHA